MHSVEKSTLPSLFLALTLSACGGGGGGGGDEANGNTLMSISGKIEGLNGEIHLSLKKEGQAWNSGIYNGNGVADVNFTIGEFESGIAYSVEVVTQPPEQNCSVTNSSGTVSSNVSNILVTCITIPQEQVGIFIDSPVTGLSYFTDTFSGETLEDGSFNYMTGEDVTFVMGSTQFTVEQLIEGAIISPLSVFSAQNSSDRRVINLARLLQSLDIDGIADNGIELRYNEISEYGPVINFDVPTEDFGANADILTFVQKVNGDAELKPLIGVDEAKEHLDNQLALVDKCALDRVFSLSSHETVIPEEVGVPGTNYGIAGGKLTLTKAGVCSIEAGEGWTGSCNIYGSKIAVTIDGNSELLTGTLANNSVTLVAMPTLFTSYNNKKEYVSAYFDGNSNVSCPVEEISPGVYDYSGKEAVSQLDGTGFDVYPVTGSITIGDSSCEIISSEGNFSCQVTGNELFGLGEASGFKGTITNSHVTMYFNSPNSGGEIVVGYFNGTKQIN